MTQKDRLLGILKSNREVSNYDLRSLNPAIFQYPVRLMELRAEGHPIIGYRDEHDKKKYWYRYVTPKKDLFDFSKEV